MNDMNEIACIFHNNLHNFDKRADDFIPKLIISLLVRDCCNSYDEQGKYTYNQQDYTNNHQ